MVALPTQGDTNPLNNQKSYCSEIINGYDDIDYLLSQQEAILAYENRTNE